ncbi:MAG: FkbM family methyltransferase [Desulfovibrionaceae bacterium]|nr:FkbM family methyltransferase [Desulfovibrionaceae bacterium]
MCRVEDRLPPGLVVGDDLYGLPENGVYALYGTGERGIRVHNLIRDRLPGARVCFFIDSFKSGTFNGLPVVQVDRLKESSAAFEAIIICSHAFPEIIDRLKGLGIDNYVVHRIANIFGVLRCSDDERLEAEEKVGIIASSLKLDSDRIFYRALMDCHFGNFEPYSGIIEQYNQEVDGLYNNKWLYAYTKKERDFLEASTKVILHFANVSLHRHYLDHVDFSKMKTVIEGGVFDGQDTCNFLERTPSGSRVIGFEPDRAKFEEIKSPCLERFEGAYCIEPYALWDCRENLWLYGQGYDGANVSRDFAESGIKVKACDLDSYVQERGIGKVDFIKLDIEGAEMNAIQGAYKTILKHRPQLAISIYHSKKDMVEIPLFLIQNLKQYTHYIGHYYIGFGETVWYCVPNEIL